MNQEKFMYLVYNLDHTH